MFVKSFDKAGGGDILNGEKQNASFALKLWLSTILQKIAYEIFKGRNL